jgi:hypothetical protein
MAGAVAIVAGAAVTGAALPAWRAARADAVALLRDG